MNVAKSHSLQQSRRGSAWQPAARLQHSSRSRLRAVMPVHAEVFRKGDAWVVAPPRKQRIKGVVHFLGGAFAGAAPQVLYSLLLDQIAAAGFTVVATPYAVTFKHLDCADTVRDSFMTALEELRSDRATASLAPCDAPVFGVGHSNGSLLHLLIGSRHPGTTQGNAVISYNNKDVSAAIPIPGFLGAVSPAVAALRTANAPALAALDSTSLLRTLSTLMPDALKRDEAGQLTGAALALDQIGTVFGEVGDGVTDFTPSPAGSRRIIREGYSAKRSPVLLVRFADDTIDESEEMHSLLRMTNPTGVSSVTLPGSHVTPCTPDVQWKVGPVFTPLDAVVSVAKWQAQADVRRLGESVIQYLDQLAQDAWSTSAADELAERQAVPAGVQQEAARRLVVARAVVDQRDD